MDAFDADVLIYAADASHPLGRRVRSLFEEGAKGQKVGVGSVLLLPELLSKPLRTENLDETDSLQDLIARLHLLAVDAATARLATALGVQYGLRSADAVHLATAVRGGADRFLTNNRRDFGQDIVEIDVVYPDELPPSAAPPAIHPRGAHD